jgi:O-antigen ligase
MIVVAAAAATALAWPSRRGRALGRAGALVLSPVLLVASLSGSSTLESLGRHPAPAVGTGLVGLAALLALARVLATRPEALPVLAVLAVPFRVPIQAAGATANLLVPLYLVIAAGTLAEVVPHLRNRESSARDHGAEGDWAPGWLERVLAASVLLYAIQGAYSSEAAKALQQMVFFYVPFSLLYALLAHRVWGRLVLRRCLLALVGLALVFGALGLYEWQTKTLLLNPRLSLSNDFHAYFRVNSFFFDPNIYGRFLALVTVAVMGTMLHLRERRALVAGAVVLLILWGSLLLTLSQSSLAAVLFGLAILAALQWSPRRTLAVLGFIAAVGLAAVLLFPSQTGVDLGSSRTVNTATSGRVDLIDGGVQLFAARPLQGFGSASFAREYRRRHRRGGTGQAVSASHTIPITVAAEQGILGLALYVALLVLAGRVLLLGARRTAARAVVAAAFFALVLHTFTYADFLEDPLTWVLLAVGSALAAQAGHHAASHSDSAAPGI